MHTGAEVRKWHKQAQTGAGEYNKGRGVNEGQRVQRGIYISIPILIIYVL